MFFFCCKQKTAYEMRISDLSSDVCSSDLPLLVTHLHVSCRYVVHDGIAEHMLQGVVLAYVLSTGTDDDSQFCFVIDLAGHGTGQDHVVVRTHQALRNLGEYNRTDRRLAIVGFE